MERVTEGRTGVTGTISMRTLLAQTTPHSVVNHTYIINLVFIIVGSLHRSQSFAYAQKPFCYITIHTIVNMFFYHHQELGFSRLS